LEKNDIEKKKKVFKKKSRLSSIIEEIENSPRTKKIKRFEDAENIEIFLNFNLELYSNKNDVNNKENISDNISNLTLGGKSNLNIVSKLAEEETKNDSDFNKEEEYCMLKQNFNYKVIIFLQRVYIFGNR